MCRTLSPLLAKLPATDAQEFGSRVAARFEKQGWHAPIVFDEAMCAALQFASKESLAHVLSGPLAVGGLRTAVLRAAEKKTDAKFGDDVWAFAAWKNQSTQGQMLRHPDAQQRTNLLQGTNQPVQP